MINVPKGFNLGSPDRFEWLKVRRGHNEQVLSYWPPKIQILVSKYPPKKMTEESTEEHIEKNTEE